MLALVSCSATALVLSPARRAGNLQMLAVEEFAISKEIKSVRVFDGEYADDICDEVAAAARACIADKGSFSLCIPGGSVVAALAQMPADAFDASKVHLFFANEKIPSYPCKEGGLDAAKKLGVPEANVHAFGEGEPAAVAESYSSLLASHASIDNSGAVPSVDMLLLGTGPDGHVGCLFPDSAEIKASRAGKVVLAGNDARADGDFVAISLDVMNAAKCVIVSAAGAGRAEMVAKALAGNFGPFDCPAGLVEAEEETLWFTDKESIAVFDEFADIEDEDELEEE